MNRRLIFVLTVLLFFTPGVFGQGAKSGKHIWRAVTGAAKERAVPALREMLSAAQKTVLEQALLRSAVQAMRTDVRRSVLNVAARDGRVLGSGFVFEEEYGGKKQLWAAVSYHVSGGAGKEVHLRLYGSARTVLRYTGRVAAAGGYGVNAADVALVPLPEEAALYVRPLRLAETEGLQEGEEARVYGFTAEHKEDLVDVSSNKLLSQSGFKLIFSNPTQQNLSGACGSPLLNRNGEVVGVFSGQRLGKQVFAVKVQAVRALLRAYRGEEVYRSVKCRGREITRLKLTETIGEVEHIRRGVWLDSKNVLRLLEPFDPEKLETLFPLQSGDVLRVSVREHNSETRTVEAVVF